MPSLAELGEQSYQLTSAWVLPVWNVASWNVVRCIVQPEYLDSPPTRSRISIGSGGESSSMLTSVEGNAVQPEYLGVTVLRRGVGEVLVVAGRASSC
jgi:hypothetical protein